MNPNANNNGEWKALHNYLYDKFIQLKISEDQFISEIKSLNCGLSDNELSNIYSLITTEDTNEINREYILRYSVFNKNMKLLRVFTKFDSNGDKTLSKSEFEDALIEMKFEQNDIESLSQTFGLDQNQTMSITDFIEGCESLSQTSTLGAGATSEVILPNSTKIESDTSHIVVESKNEEIDDFISSIGSNIDIKDERDKEIIDQLIEFIKICKSDCKLYKQNLHDSETRYKELETQYIELNDSIKKINTIGNIAGSHQVQLSLDIKHDATGSIDIDTSNIAKDLELTQLEQIKKDVSEIVQNEQERSDNLAKTIENREKELEILDNEIKSKQSTLVELKQQRNTISNLEQQNLQLTDTLSDSASQYQSKLGDKDKEILNQNEIISNQQQMISTMEDDINRLESYITELREAVKKGDNDVQDLTTMLHEKDKILHAARQKSNDNLVRLRSHLSMRYSNDGNLANNNNTQFVEPNLMSLTSAFEYDEMDGMMDTNRNSNVDIAGDSFRSGGIIDHDIAGDSWRSDHSLLSPTGPNDINKNNMFATGKNLQQVNDELKQKITILENEKMELKQHVVLSDKAKTRIEDEMNKLREEMDKMKNNYEIRINELEQKNINNTTNNNAVMGNNNYNNIMDNEEKTDERKHLIDSDDEDENDGGDNRNSKGRRARDYDKDEAAIEQVSCVLFGFPVF